MVEIEPICCSFGIHLTKQRHGNLIQPNDYFTFSIELVNLRCLAQLINLTSKNQADLLSMHLQQQPLHSRVQVEINIVCQREVAVRLQNQFVKQIEVTSVGVRVGSSGELLLANEVMY